MLKIVEGTFAARLDLACDKSDKVPAHGYGRQVHLAEFLKVSNEAIRKYFVGASKPRRDNIAKLAEYLGVDVTWLEYGSTPLHKPKERKANELGRDGAVYLAFANVILAGHSAAFANEGDTCDFIAIRGASMDRVAISKGELDGDGYVFHFPTDTNNLTCIGIVTERSDPTGGAIFLRFTPPILKGSGVAGMEHIEVKVKGKGRKWEAGELAVQATKTVL
jgi:hypothetical protein